MSKIKYMRKATSAKAIKNSFKSFEDEEVRCYNNDKLSMDEYQKVSALSAHVLKDFANPNLSDYYLHRKYVKRDLEDKTSSAFNVGSALHTAVLEPDLFDNEYAVAPKVDRRTKQGKIDWQMFLDDSEGKTVLTDEQFELVNAMTKAVKSNKYAKEILKGTHKEESVFKRIGDKIFKGRGDAVSHKHQYIADLKMVSDVSPAGFAKASANFRYDIQDHVYRTLFGYDEFVFICVENKEPYEVAIYILNEDYQAKAERDFNFAVERWEKIRSEVSVEGFCNIENPTIVLAPPKWFTYED